LSEFIAFSEVIGLGDLHVLLGSDFSRSDLRFFNAFSCRRFQDMKICFIAVFGSSMAFVMCFRARALAAFCDDLVRAFRWLISQRSLGCWSGVLQMFDVDWEVCLMLE
jgi:hypothetical protein